MAALGWVLNLGFAGGTGTIPGPAVAADLLAATLAASATWQTLCGVADGDQALRRIFYEGLPLPEDGETHDRDELIALRPYALIYQDERGGRRDAEIAAGRRIHYRPGGRLIVELVRNAPDPDGDDPPGAATLDWSNRVGQIMSDLCMLGGEAGYLAFTRLVLTRAPYWCSRDRAETDGLWQGATLAVEW